MYVSDLLLRWRHIFAYILVSANLALGSVFIELFLIRVLLGIFILFAIRFIHTAVADGGKLLDNNDSLHSSLKDEKAMHANTAVEMQKQPRGSVISKKVALPKQKDVPGLLNRRAL